MLSLNFLNRLNDFSLGQRIVDVVQIFHDKLVALHKSRSTPFNAAAKIFQDWYVDQEVEKLERIGLHLLKKVMNLLVGILAFFLIKQLIIYLSAIEIDSLNIKAPYEEDLDYQC